MFYQYKENLCLVHCTPTTVFHLWVQGERFDPVQFTEKINIAYQ